MSLSKPAKYSHYANPNEILVNTYCKRTFSIHIPSEIIQLCSLFYCGYQDKWDIQSLNALQIDRNIIGHKLLNGHYFRLTSFRTYYILQMYFVLTHFLLAPLPLRYFSIGDVFRFVITISHGTKYMRNEVSLKYLYSTWTTLSYGFGVNGIKKGQIFTWNFRVLHFCSIPSNGYYGRSFRDEAVIGIVEYDKNTFDGQSGYGLWLNMGYRKFHPRYHPHRQYEPNEYNQYANAYFYLSKLSHDDIIEMTLDLRDKKELTVKINYRRNYKSYTFSNIDCENDKVYKMMLGIQGGYNIFELNPTQDILDYHKQYIIERYRDNYRESMECCEYYQDKRISMAHRLWNQSALSRGIKSKALSPKAGHNNTPEGSSRGDKEIRQYYQDQRISIR